MEIENASCPFVMTLDIRSLEQVQMNIPYFLNISSWLMEDFAFLKLESKVPSKNQ